MIMSECDRPTGRGEQPNLTAGIRAATGNPQVAAAAAWIQFTERTGICSIGCQQHAKTTPLQPVAIVEADRGGGTGKKRCGRAAGHGIQVKRVGQGGGGAGAVQAAGLKAYGGQ